MKLYKKCKKIFAFKKPDETQQSIKTDGIIIYKSYNHFSFHTFFKVVARSKAFEILMLLVIVANSAISAYSAEYEVKNRGEVLDIVNILEIFFLSTYATEFVIKIIAFPMKYWFSGWNIFDFIILILSFLPYIGTNINLSYVRAFRAFRCFRILRSIHAFRQLRILLNSLIKTMQKAFVLIIMLFIFMLIFAIAGLYLFGQAVPEPWNDLGTALLTIFAITTKDAWNVYQDDLDVAFGEASRVFSVAVVLFTGIIFSSLVVAAVTDSFSEAAEAQQISEKKAQIEQNQKYIRSENSIFQKAKYEKFVKSAEDAQLYNDKVSYTEDDYDFIKHLHDKGDIDPQRTTFTNPAWMKSVCLSLTKLQEYNNIKLKLYNDMFQGLLKMSDFTKPPPKEKLGAKNDADAPKQPGLGEQF